MQGFAHAVQALELEVVAFAARHLEDRRAGVGVVGRELRIDPVAHVEQHPRAGHVGQIGIHLAREHREGRRPELLRQLDLRIPVGALDQAHHDLAVESLGQRVEMPQHLGRAFAIGLDDDAEAVPTLKALIRQHGIDDVEGDIQPVLFLGVDVETDPGLCRHPRQLQAPRDHLPRDRLALRGQITRRQCRELDRDPGVVANIAVRDLRDLRDRVGVAVEEGLRIRLGSGPLAEHVVRIGIALFAQRLAALDALFDGLAEDELLAHDAHRPCDRRAHHGLAQALHQPARAGCRLRGIIVENAPGQHQRPGRRVDQRREGLPEMRTPVRRRDLVFDQVVDGLGIGYAQQRLGQAHEADAFVGGEAILVEEGLHHGRVGIVADALDQRRCRLHDGVAPVWREP